jgi:NTE family protein
MSKSLRPNIQVNTLTTDEVQTYAAVLNLYRNTKAGKLAITCVGGGAKGEWQAGFLYFMWQIGLLSLVDLFTGTSVGGLNSLLASLFIADYQKALDVWRGIGANSDVYNGQLPSSGIFSILRNLPKLFSNSPSLLDPSPLEAIAKGVFTDLRASQLPRPVFTVADNRVPNRRVVLGHDTEGTDRHQDDLCVDMALATSRVPCAFPPYRYKDMLLFDGAVYNNIPVDLAIEKGASKVFVLFCDPDPDLHPVEDSGNTILGNGLTMLNNLYQQHEMEMWRSLELREAEQAKHGGPVQNYGKFYPSRATGSLLDFERKGSSDIMQLGYDDARKYLTPEKLSTILTTSTDVTS